MPTQLRSLAFAFVATIVANLLLWPDLPLTVQAVAALVLTLILPGWLLCKWWLGRSRPGTPDRWEHAIYSVAAGFGVQTLALLGLAYWPAPVTFARTLLLFDLLVGALLLLNGLAVYRGAGKSSPAGGSGIAPSETRRALLALTTVLLLGGLLRFANLGYSEFQGDEARAVLRAAAVLQGHGEVLFQHRKGPLEILAPTAIYALTGQLTEATARLPSALAGTAGLLAILVLGWRMFGLPAGFVAALLLAVDGYLIGFARIVQYQSVVLLTTVAVVLLLFRLTAHGHVATRLLVLAAFLLATGILAHYEAALAAIPAAFLLWRHWWPTRPPGALRALTAGLAVGAIALGVFYVPYVLNPSFAGTFAYLAAERVGGQPPYNHLAEFFLRTTLYDTTYAVLLQIGLALAALVRVYCRGLPGPWGGALAALAAAGLALTFVQPAWLAMGGVDYTFAFFLVLFALAWVLPGQGVAERTLWIWFGSLVLLALFFVARPRTHVYVFFIPWALLSGMMAQVIWQWLVDRLPLRMTQVAAAGAVLLGTAVCGTYAYLYFVDHRVEILRDWAANRPPGFWTVYDSPDDRSLFGFPQQNGWKTAGVLYAQGTLDGPYTTNGLDEWVSEWYTRGAARCLRDHRYLLVAQQLGPSAQQQTAEFLAALPAAYALRSVVEVDGRPRLQIYERGGLPAEAHILKASQLATEFDAHLSGANRPLSTQVVMPTPVHALDVRFGNAIRLEGYDLDRTVVRPGEAVNLTLYWRAGQEIEERYAAEVQLANEGGITAQVTGEPGCGDRPTDDWAAGELIADPYTVVIDAVAPAGEYALSVALRDTESGSALAGRAAGGEVREFVDLAVIEVTAGAP